jgi:hypothetical protein
MIDGTEAMNGREDNGREDGEEEVARELTYHSWATGHTYYQPEASR